MKNSKPSSTASKLSRRTLFTGASAAGAMAVAASLLPGQQVETHEPAADPTPEKGGGYRLSEHIKHYYQTTRI